MVLLIEKKDLHGNRKTWKLSGERPMTLLGTAKNADVKLEDQTQRGLAGFFELRKDQWVFVDLKPGLAQPEKLLTGPVELTWGTEVMQVTPLLPTHHLFQQNDQAHYLTEASGTQPYQLYLVYHQSQLIESALVAVGEKLNLKSFPKDFQEPARHKSDDWKFSNFGELTLKERTVYLNPKDVVKSESLTSAFDKDSRLMLAGILGCGVLLATLLTFAPHSPTVETLPLAVREVNLPPVTPLEKRIPPAKKIEKIEPKVAQAAPAVNSGGAGSSAPKGASQSVSNVPRLGSGRLSSLISKVSAAAPNSKVIIVSSGVAASALAPSGRALAAVGSSNKDGTDWSQAGSADGAVVATRGTGSSVGTGTSLKAGRTGSGGVGILEEETQIVGGLDKDVIAQFIKARLGQILYCYERELSAQPDLYGKVAVKFTIAGTGLVSERQVNQSTLANLRVENCILQKISAWKFPEPRGGTNVVVTYPFLFKSTN